MPVIALRFSDDILEIVQQDSTVRIGAVIPDVLAPEFVEGKTSAEVLAALQRTLAPQGFKLRGQATDKWLFERLD